MLGRCSYCTILDMGEATDLHSRHEESKPWSSTTGPAPASLDRRLGPTPAPSTRTAGLLTALRIQEKSPSMMALDKDTQRSRLELSRLAYLRP
jgi:hypothetical protein